MKKEKEKYPSGVKRYYTALLVSYTLQAAASNRNGIKIRQLEFYPPSW
jgi:hypothetical protein